MLVLTLDRHVHMYIDAVLPPEAQLYPEEEMFENADSYGADPRVLEHLRSHSASYDLIIIGNNLGAGLVKASRVPPGMRERVVIVWNDAPNEYTTAPYKAMGYRHFSRRMDLMKFLENNPEIYTR